MEEQIHPDPENESPATVHEPEEILEVADATVLDEAAPEAAPEISAQEGHGRLIIKRANVETDEVFDFVAPAIIGRFDPTVGPIDIDLGSTPEGSYVSRKHAKITFEDGQWRIEDLGSSNGTYVLKTDFEKIESSELNDGDEIALGNARLVFRVSS